MRVIDIVAYHSIFSLIIFSESLQGRKSRSLLASHIPRPSSSHRHPHTSSMLHLLMVPTLCCLKVIALVHGHQQFKLTKLLIFHLHTNQKNK